jgi:hypothetical protein
MIKGSLVRRLLDALVSLVTWGAAVGAVLWFYDWVNRWYIVVGVLLAIVAGAIITERITGHDAAEPAAAVLPMVPDTAVADVAWSASPEQQIA